ncbi:acetyl-CoA acetyltransferase [Methylobacterium oryzae CBMB20]
MTRACIVGWAHTPFGKLEEPDVEGLIARVSGDALAHAGVEDSQVDGIYVGSMNTGFSKQGFEGSLVAVNRPGLAHAPATHLENACATGSAALYAALDFVDSGRGRVALVIGAEKMTAKTVAETGDILLGASYRKEEADIEGGFAGVFGRIAAGYFQRYGDRSEELARIAAKNHRNGVGNPYAQLRKDLGFDFCNRVSEKNPYVAAPLRRTDCSLISDGAAALVVADAETAEGLERAIGFRARAHVNDILPLSRRDPAEFKGARMAWEKARAQAGIANEDLSFVETHDCFTIAELIEYEAMGSPPGRGLPRGARGAGREGRPAADQPVRRPEGQGPSGRRHRRVDARHGHLQLMGEAGEMQVPGAELAGIFNMGGAAVANYVSILERRR